MPKIVFDKRKLDRELAHRKALRKLELRANLSLALVSRRAIVNDILQEIDAKLFVNRLSES